MAQSQYATIAELQSLSITQAAAARFGSTAMTACLQAASSIADGYLASQFTLPLDTSPQGWDMSLTLQVCNIAAWLLYNQFGFSPSAPGDALVVGRYEAAIKWLEHCSEEKIFPQFIDSSGTPVGETEAGDYVDSDLPVGFTDRGWGRRNATNTCGTGLWGGWDW